MATIESTARRRGRTRLGTREHAQAFAVAAMLALGLVRSNVTAAADAVRTPDVSATQVPLIQLGPIRFGMSLDEMQAAVPGARWEVTTRSKFTGRAFNVVAADAFDFGGRRMEVRARDEKYDRDVVLTSRTTEPDVQSCERAGLAFLGALEQAAGQLQGDSSAYGELVPFGNGSTALFTAFDPRSRLLARKSLGRAQVDRMGLAAKREMQRLEVKGQVSYDARGAGNCVTTATVMGWREHPPLAVMAYDERKVVRRMSIGDRHRLASTVVLPDESVLVPQQCQVSRQTGSVLMCQARGDGAASADVASVAGRYAGAMAFDTSSLDRDDPEPVLVEIPVRVARTDVRPLGFSAPLLPMSEVAFDASPSAKEIQQVFPWKALRSGVGAQVDAACQVQSDGSLVCRTLAVRQHDGRNDQAVDFERALEKLLPLYRAAPALKNGQPSADAVFGMGMKFEVGG